MVVGNGKWQSRYRDVYATKEVRLLMPVLVVSDYEWGLTFFVRYVKRTLDCTCNPKIKFNDNQYSLRIVKFIVIDTDLQHIL